MTPRRNVAACHRYAIVQGSTIAVIAPGKPAALMLLIAAVQGCAPAARQSISAASQSRSTVIAPIDQPDRFGVSHGVPVSTVSHSNHADVSAAGREDTRRLTRILERQLEPSPSQPPTEDADSVDAASTLAGPVTVGGAPRDATSRMPRMRALTEQEMLSIAVANAPALRTLGVRVLTNPEAVATVYDRAIQASDPFFGPAAALSEFDATWSGSIQAENNDRVFNNTTLGGEVQELTQDLVTARSGWQKRAWSGAVFDLQSIHQYDDNNRQANRFPNYYESFWEAGIRQPLLRGAGRRFNAIAGPNARPGFNFSNGIVIARLNTQISDADFEIALRTFVDDLYQSYWALYRQSQILESLFQAERLAYQTWQAIRAKQDADLKGGEAYKEAQARARYHRLRREVAIAFDGASEREGYYVIERQLRRQMGLPLVDGQVLRPVDPPAAARFVFDHDDLMARGLASRTELRRQRLRVQQQRYRLLAAKNFLLPQLDLIGRYRLRGFGDDLTGDGPRFASAADDFYSLDHQEWQFGVEMNVPVGRRQARAAVTHARLDLIRQQTVLREQERSLQLELSQAQAEVGSAYEALDASRQIVDAARRRLESSQVLYDTDKLGIEFLLDAQEELVRAERQLAEDQSRYSLSLIRINTTAGTLLADVGVHLAVTCHGQHDIGLAGAEIGTLID